MGRRQLCKQPVSYYLVTEDYEDFGERYGVRVENDSESETICGITVSQTGIFELIAALMAGRVTPTTVRDVVEDWLLA